MLCPTKKDQSQQVQEQKVTSKMCLRIYMLVTINMFFQFVLPGLWIVAELVKPVETLMCCTEQPPGLLQTAPIVHTDLVRQSCNAKSLGSHSGTI